MSRVPRWGYGSKRRIQLIRWNGYQIAGIVLLAFSLMLLGFFLARLLASLAMHEREKQENSLKQPRPADIGFLHTQSPKAEQSFGSNVGSRSLERFNS